MKLDQAHIIKVSAVLTAIPRWVVALMAAEGFALPESWMPAWIVFSASSAVGMAIVEGVAFSYVFAAWRNQKDSRANRLLILAIVSAVLFIILLTPSIAASVSHKAINEILTNNFLLVGWSAIVAASTISIVASVGYAEKIQLTKPYEKPTSTPDVSNISANGVESVATPTKTYKCVCGQEFSTGPDKAIHSRRCSEAIAERVEKLAKKNGHTEGVSN